MVKVGWRDGLLAVTVEPPKGTKARTPHFVRLELEPNEAGDLIVKLAEFLIAPGDVNRLTAALAAAR